MQREIRIRPFEGRQSRPRSSRYGIMAELPMLQTVDNWAADADFLSRTIKSLPQPLEILEAGCGREWPIKLEGVRYRLTGIDLDEAALESRVRDVGDLHEAI